MMNKKKVSCPWIQSANAAKTDEQEQKEDENKNDKSKETSINQQTQQAVDEASKKTETTTETTATPAASSGVYIAPHLRNRDTKTADKSSDKYAIPTTSVNYRRPNKSQPNIMDTSEFPTLGNMEPASVDKSSNGTEK